MENIKNSIIMPPLYFKCKQPEANNQVIMVIYNYLTLRIANITILPSTVYINDNNPSISMEGLLFSHLIYAI